MEIFLKIKLINYLLKYFIINIIYYKIKIHLCKKIDIKRKIKNGLFKTNIHNRLFLL